MNEYWYIWCTMYEDGKEVGKLKYFYPYKNKSSAERRAKQMWSEDLYNPMTNTTIHRKWTVSKTNVWEDEKYGYV